MSQEKNIHENHLDDLLRDLYLEENSISPNEIYANFILEQNYPVKIDPEKEKDLIEKLSGKKGGFGSSGLFLSTLLCVSVLISAYFILTKERNIKTKKNNAITITPTSYSKTHNSLHADNIHTPLAKPEEEKTQQIDTFGKKRHIEPIIISDSLLTNAKTEAVLPVTENFEKRAPYLSEKDLSYYKRVKEQIIKRLLATDKNLYTKIPANKITYAGAPLILDGYTLRNVGITNLEYKTFLADLLAAKRDEDYFVCEVHSEYWSLYNCNLLAIDYFVDDKYNDFPVVNISLEGAKQFCKWLEDEVRNYAVQNKLRQKELKIQLPNDAEWINAAREGYAKIAYDKNKYNTIYDLKEGLVDDNFGNREEVIKKRVKKIDTLYTKYTTNRFGWTEKEILNFFNSSLTAFQSIRPDTIYTDRMKVLGKIGRVSEMGPQNNASHTWLIGLTWANKEEYLKLENQFKTNNASPFVGFRIVIIDPNDPEYKNPFW